MATITESIADRLSGGKISEQTTVISELQEVNRQNNLNLAMVQESLQRLEQALYSPEWRMLTFGAEQEFTRQGIREISLLARIMKLKNPLVKRGVKIQRLYVWAQGVTITAVDPQVNEVVQAFLDDERNQAELTSHQVRGEREEDLQSDGGFFIRFFVNEITGRVRMAVIDANEIEDVICNPENKREPWFYKRCWTKVHVDGTQTTMTEYYPDWQFKPRSQIAFNGRLPGGTIIWNTPVMAVISNRMGRFPICEYYDANDWALAYKNFLEQLASVWASLARWSAKLTTKGGARGVAAAKTRMNTTMAEGTPEGNPPPVTGSVFLQSEGVDLQPFRTAGATMSADDGRRLQLMGAMSFGFPETFYGDTDAGTLATATSLDRPTELKIVDRQHFWEDAHQSVFSFALLWAVKAPQGLLRGLASVMPERDGDQLIERVVWNEGIDPTITIQFPAVIEHDVTAMVTAINDAQTLSGRPAGEGIPLETAVRMLLTELHVQDVDAVMELWQEEQAEREAKAEELAAQMAAQGAGAADGGEDEEGSDEPAMEAIWQRQVTAVTGLLTDIREVVGVNGHA